MGTGQATYAAALMVLACTALGCGSDDENPPPGDTDPCAGFEDDAEAPIQLILANLSQEPIVVATRATQPATENGFDIVDPSGTEVDVGVPTCTCTTQQESAMSCVFSSGGPEFDVTIVPAGRRTTFTWDGRLSERVSMPSSCFADQVNTFDACNVRRAAEPGTYRARIEVGLGATGCVNGPCDCEPGEESCTDQAFTLDTTSTVTLETTLEVGSASSATLSYSP